ncbi:MAG: F0F1 ATP synthase subunit gamma [Thiobacillaceae bacterium]|nr:F0F1 ATP synthase subunit gamma [Thiobacillaceae bacterium]MCX7672083.1 F0F1 ATP synthase subunit gamma [Thiobacillaceae bacterium]MDW8322610.1 F0F1 ATP synthase subunit gamma [Burkholderiales bacterium]
MAAGKEIRNKIKSVENTRKITKAMEMVAASKMRRAQERMRAARPYAEKIGRVVAHFSQAHSEYKHPCTIARETLRRVGLILITTDKGLCGALNTNVLRLAVGRMKEWSAQGIDCDVTVIGNKGLGFMQRVGANIVSQVTGLGDTPHVERLIGPVQVMVDAYKAGRIDALYMVYSRFINTMKQEPVMQQVLPLTADAAMERHAAHWDYIYEPEAKVVVDALMIRYIEALIYQAVAENMACEQSARMVAMKAASDNAKNVIEELKLVYNKTRQAAITQELSEIVAGAAAV